MIRRLQLTSVVLPFVLLLLPAEAQAQLCNLRGRVVDVEGEPLRDVIVKLEPAAGDRTYEMKTDKKGRFRRIDVRAGMYRIIFSKDGYSKFSDQVRVSIGSNQVPKVELVEARSGVAGLTVLELEGVRAEFDEAAKLVAAGELDAAVAKYEQILLGAPELVEAHANLANVYRLKKDWAAAEAELLQVIQKRPQVEISLALAVLYEESQQKDKLHAHLEKSAASYAENVLFQLEAGRLYYNLLDVEKAAAAFHKASSLDPSQPEPYFFLGALAISQNEHAEAVAQLKKYLSMAGPDATYVPQAKQLLETLEAAPATDEPG